jgi:hypothetical protein
MGSAGVGGGALRKRSFEKSSCVRLARRRRERDTERGVLGEGGGGTWRGEVSNASSK